MSGPYGILVVCTANVCRSPMAEHFIRVAAEAAGTSVDVSSSGFLSAGEPATPLVVDVMQEWDGDLTAHRSRQTSQDMIERSDLVVTMERRHARDLVLLAPGSSWKIHTLVALVTALEESRAAPDAAERVRGIAAARPGGAHLGSGADEIDDPFGRSRRVNRATAERLADLSPRLIAGLFSPAD